MPGFPHGGKLIQLTREPRHSEELGKLFGTLLLKVTPETQKTILNIGTGVLSPLDGFMTRDDYHNVVNQMRLRNDVPWTIPILLHVPLGFEAGSGDDIALTNEDGNLVAVLAFEEAYEISKKEYAKKVFGTEDVEHPGVAKIYEESGRVVAGKLKEVSHSQDDAFANVTLSPKETRFLFVEKGWRDVVAFQTRNAPHVGHEYVQKTALAYADGIFINPVLGKKKSGDFTDDVIVKSYQTLVKNYYPKNTVVLSVLHYEMQYAGPREAIMHAIMRKNFGCTHIAIGRDHAGVGNYYSPYAAQDIFKDFPDLGITPLFFREFFYCTKCIGIANEKICPHPESARLSFSGTKLRNLFQSGESPPREFMRPEVAEVILHAEKPFVE